MHVAFSRQSVSNCFHYHLVPDRPAEDTGLQGTTAHQILVPFGDPRRTLRSSPPLPNPGPRPKIFSSSTNLVAAWKLGGLHLTKRLLPYRSHPCPHRIVHPSIAVRGIIFQLFSLSRPGSVCLIPTDLGYCVFRPSRLEPGPRPGPGLGLELKAFFCFQRQFGLSSAGPSICKNGEWSCT